MASTERSATTSSTAPKTPRPARYSRMRPSSPNPAYRDKPGPKFSTASEKEWIQYDSELSIYQRLTPHPRILGFHGEGRSEKEPYILLDDPVMYEDLFNYLPEFADQTDYSIRLQWAVEIAEGLAHLHKNGVVWVNASPKNMQVTDDLHIVLFNFAGSQMLPQFPASVSAENGWRNPRGFSSRGYWRRNQDFFAFGVTLFGLLTLRWPHNPDLFPDALKMESLHANFQFETLSREDYPTLADVIDKCLWGRYTSADVLLDDVRRGKEECLKKGPPELNTLQVAVWRTRREFDNFFTSRPGMLVFGFLAGILVTLCLTHRGNVLKSIEDLLLHLTETTLPPIFAFFRRIPTFASAFFRTLSETLDQPQQVQQVQQVQPAQPSIFTKRNIPITSITDERFYEHTISDDL